MNNTNLDTGLRMHHDDPKEFNRSLQEMAKERKLLFLADEREPKEGLERLAAKNRPVRARPKTLQQVHIGRAERELASGGSYSWVADIRNRVSVAKSLARNQAEFTQILRMLGVDIADNSRNAKRDDWIYSLADAPSRRVSGERLGLLFSKETVLRQMRRSGAYRPDARSSKEILRNARDAVLVNDLEDLSELSEALRTCAYHGASSIHECESKLDALRKRAERSEGRTRSSLLQKAEALESAKNYMEAHSLLPVRISKTSTPKAASRTTALKGKSGKGMADTNPTRERQQEQTQERDQR